MNRVTIVLSFLSLAMAGCSSDVADSEGFAAEGGVELHELPQALSSGSVYRFENSKSGRCIGVDGASTAHGALIKQFTCDSGAPNQRWRAGSDGRLTNVKSGKCMGVDGASVSPGANLAQFNCDGAPNQQWGAVYSGDPPVGVLVNLKSYLCIGVDGASIANGAQLKQFDCNETAPNQRWIWRE